jgi:hypothetical protein
MEPAVQLSLPLFDPPTFDDLLEKRAVTTALSVVVNPRFKHGWQVKFLPFSKQRQLFVPRCFDSAPEEIKNRLIDWALLPCRPGGQKKSIVRKQRLLLEKQIRDHMESLPNAPRRASRFNPAAFAGNSAGKIFDLREVFAAVNAAYYNVSLTAHIRWGKPRSKMSYHMTKTDAAGNKVNLITIAGVYDHPEVPRFAIEAIMYHEMLHIAIPPHKNNGRNVIHGKEFKEREKIFRQYAQWRKWEREKLPALARRPVRARKRSLLRGIFHF